MKTIPHLWPLFLIASLALGMAQTLSFQTKDSHEYLFYEGKMTRTSDGDYYNYNIPELRLLYKPPNQVRFPQYLLLKKIDVVATKKGKVPNTFFDIILSDEKIIDLHLNPNSPSATLSSITLRLPKHVVEVSDFVGIALRNDDKTFPITFTAPTGEPQQPAESSNSAPDRKTATDQSQGLGVYYRTIGESGSSTLHLTKETNSEWHLVLKSQSRRTIKVHLPRGQTSVMISRLPDGLYMIEAVSGRAYDPATEQWRAVYNQYVGSVQLSKASSGDFELSKQNRLLQEKR
jgi:hypothetical protein